MSYEIIPNNGRKIYLNNQSWSVILYIIRRLNKAKSLGINTDNFEFNFCEWVGIANPKQCQKLAHHIEHVLKYVPKQYIHMGKHSCISKKLLHEFTTFLKTCEGFKIT